MYIKTIFLPARVLEIFLRLNIFPPVDWFLGRGVYVFPNYRNWSLWKSKSLTYIYDLGFIRHPETVQPKNQKYLSRYIRRWVSRTNLVVTITQRMKEEIEESLYLSPQQIEVVYCGVDKSVFYKRSKSEILAVKNKYNIAFDNYILFVGNIEPRKNLSKLLEAYELLPISLRNTYGLLIVGGDGWLNESFYKKMESMVAEGYKVLKLNEYVPTEDLPALYSGASVLAHPAIYEGFGMTPLEAMACGTPVAVSDIATIREVIKDPGQYFDPYNPMSIGQALIAAVSDDKHGKDTAYEASIITNNFTWDHTAEQLLHSIERIYLERSEKPVIKRLLALYKWSDRKIRALLGERVLSPYRPLEAKSIRQLREIVLYDFLREQPSLAQRLLLSAYLRTKHIVGVLLKKGYRMARSSS